MYGYCHKVIATAYAEDVVNLKKQNKTKQKSPKYLKLYELYELASGAKLNYRKTEGVWIGANDDKSNIDTNVKQEIKILGLIICNRDCGERNWEIKLNEVKDEVKKWENKSTNYKSRKTFILSNLIFVANMSKYVN